ncbi:MAG: ABC transporter ATP-binding protein [Dehalococcoidia bacterium]
MTSAQTYAPTSAPAIETARLGKQYRGGVRALADVDLAVPAGTVYGLLGQNGAGKTTLIRILLDMIRPTEGAARILGFDCQDDGVVARSHVGYLPSSSAYYSYMTGDDLFDFVARARGVPRDAALQEDLIARLDLNPDRAIRTLSRGNQQKVGLVAALLARPEVVILDEPTSGLDPLMQDVVLDIVREVAAEGRTVFFSSHILTEVERVCDHVAVLRAGRLVGAFDLAEQRRIAARTVSVRFDGPPPPASAFEGLDGARFARVEAGRVVFEVRNGFDALVKRLAQFTVLDIDAREPTLEDFFLSLYTDAPEAAGGGA